MIEARKYERSIFPNLGRTPIKWADIRRIGFLTIWLVIAALYGLGAEVVGSKILDASTVPIEETINAEPASSKDGGTGGRNSENDAIVEYFSNSCTEGPDSLYSIENGLDTAPVNPIPASMCIA